MKATELSKKLLFKSGHQVLLLNAPEYFTSLLEPLPGGISFSAIPFERPELVIAFVMDSNELHTTLTLISSTLKPETIIWIAYPKKSSGINSNLSMNSWNLTEFGLSGVASASIDEIWTGIRLKPTTAVKKSGLGNAEIQHTDLGKYIDVQNRRITLPPDLKEELVRDEAAISFFEKISYTNQKEYVTWVLTAKQEKTRQERIYKTRLKLLAGKKNPSEK